MPFLLGESNKKRPGMQQKQRHQFLLFTAVARVGRENQINLPRLECKLEKANQKVKSLLKATQSNSLNSMFSP